MQRMLIEYEVMSWVKYVRLIMSEACPLCKAKGSIKRIVSCHDRGSSLYAVVYCEECDARGDYITTAGAIG